MFYEYNAFRCELKHKRTASFAARVKHIVIREQMHPFEQMIMKMILISLRERERQSSRLAEGVSQAQLSFFKKSTSIRQSFLPIEKMTKTAFRI